MLTTKSNVLHHLQPNVELFRREHVEECAKELQITELIVKQNVDDLAENLKCIWRCLGSKSGILLDNGDIDERVFVVALYKQKGRVRGKL